MSEVTTQLIRLCFLMTKVLMYRGVRRRNRFSRRKQILREHVSKLYGARKLHSRLNEERVLYMKMLTSWVQSNTFRRDPDAYEPNWWENTVLVKYTDSEWRKYFHMSKGTFFSVANQLKNRLSAANPGLPPLKQVGIAVFSMASGKQKASVACLFQVPKPLVTQSVRDVCDAVIRVLMPRHVTVPEGSDLDKHLEAFENNWGFPHCAGVLNSIHIPISKSNLPENGSDYLNNKGEHSMILQVVVSPSYTFWDVNVGWPGSVTESRVFTSSILWTKGQDGKLFPDKHRLMSGTEVPIVLLAGTSYPLADWVLKPYQRADVLPDDELKYNEKFSFVHCCSEVALKRLKARWNCLVIGNMCSIDIFPNVAAACCVLHNICEEAREPVFDEWMMRAECAYKQPTPSPCNSVIGTQAETIQKAVKDYFQMQYAAQ